MAQRYLHLTAPSHQIGDGEITCIAFNQYNDMYSFILYCMEYDYIYSNRTNYIFTYFYILIQQQVSNANNNQSSLKRNFFFKIRWFLPMIKNHLNLAIEIPCSQTTLQYLPLPIHRTIQYTAMIFCLYFQQLISIKYLVQTCWRSIYSLTEWIDVNK